MKSYFFEIECLIALWILLSSVYMIQREKSVKNYKVVKNFPEWIQSTTKLMFCALLFFSFFYLETIEDSYRYVVSFLFLFSINWFIEEYSYEYWTNILLLFLTVLLFFTLENLFLIFLLLEIQTFIIYFLVIKQGSRESTRSVIQFFFQNVVVTFFFLIGLYLCYVNFESFSVTRVEDFFLFLLIFFKLGLFPFHLWVLNVLKVTNKLLAFLLGVYLKFVYFFFIFKFCFYPSSLFLLMGLTSLIFGSIGGLFQMSWILVFVYSMIVNVGNILMIYSFGSFISLIFAIYVQLVYLILSTFFLLALRELKEEVKDSSNEYTMNGWSGITYSILFFSFMGIPPFVGFFIKIPLIILLFSKQAFWLLWIFFMANLFSLFLYLRGTKYLIFGGYQKSYWCDLKFVEGREKRERAMILTSMNGFQLFFLCFMPMILVWIVELCL
jgi:NADH-quinone oxidoreductase subunit N